MLNDEDKEQIPEEFIEMLLNNDDLSLVEPLDPSKSLKDITYREMMKRILTDTSSEIMEARR